MHKAHEEFQDFLRRGKFKRTRTREHVFREVFRDPAVHPNASEIQQRLRRRGQTVSLATIYRTLNLLVRSGLVSEIDLGENHGHFEPKRSETGHGHLICLSCGKVKEFTGANIQRTVRRIGEAKDFRLDKFSIQVFGYCRKCKGR